MSLISRLMSFRFFGNRKVRDDVVVTEAQLQEKVGPVSMHQHLVVAFMRATRERQQMQQNSAKQ